MGHDVRIRNISGGDWPGITALEAGTYTESGLSEGREALESRARASPATCFVLDCDREIVGYVLTLPYPIFQYPDLMRAEEVVFHSRNLHLHDLVIAEKFRGAGWGKRLLGRLAETAERKMYERISLIAVGGSDAFWSAHGYEPHREVLLPQSYGSNAVYMSMEIRGRRAKNAQHGNGSLYEMPPEDEVG